MDRTAARSFSTFRRLRRAVLARRRPLAAVTAAVSVLVGLHAAAPAPSPTRSLLVAARDLPAGSVLTREDLELTSVAPASVPAGAAGSPGELLGRTTAGPVRAGEPITDVRIVNGSLLDGYPGLVAAPVRIADPAVVGLLRVGDLVDVIAADPQGRSEAVVVAAAAPVVALPAATETALASGGLVVLAVTGETATQLAAATVSGYLSVVISR